jgi:hypothetical protein
MNEPFSSERVQREMRIIHNDLHCTAVRLTGGDADRLEIAARHAAAAGLEVWYSPFTCDLTTDELLASSPTPPSTPNDTANGARRWCS